MLDKNSTLADAARLTRKMPTQNFVAVQAQPAEYVQAFAVVELMA